MLGAHHPVKASRGWLIISLRWAAALVVLGVLFHFLPVAPLRAAFARVPATRFLSVLFFYLCAHAVGIAKWRMVVNAAGAELDFASCAQCYTGGLFGTLFLPSIIGGDVIRLAVGLRRSPRPAAVLAGNLADRFLDVAAQGALFFLGFVLLPGSLPDAWQLAARRALAVFLLLAAIAVILMLILRRPLLGGRSVRFRRRLARFRYALGSVSRRPRVLAMGWVLGLAVQGSFLFLTALIAVSCGLLLPLRVWLFAWPLAKLAALLPLTQGGIGVREAALVALLAPFGAAAPLTLAAGLLWEGVVIAGGLIAGLAAFLLRRSQTPIKTP